MAKTTTTATAVGPVDNGGEFFIGMRTPYQVGVELTGVSDMLFHGWNCASIQGKQEGPKGGRAKKTDDLESYVYRNDTGHICVPGTYIIGSIGNAAKYRQDPRSPRKSAFDLFRAGVVSLTALAPLGKAWDYEHRCRVTIQRNGITRCRPAFKAGWRARFELQVILPEYIAPDMLHETLVDAGRLVGLADWRPTYGRFAVTHFERLTLQ